MTNDLTKGSPFKLLLFFSIPLLIGNIFQQVYNMADTIIVGRTLGVQALAGVGATGSIIFLVIGFVQGVTSGFAVVTAQRFGAEDEDGVRGSIAISILLSVIIGAVVTVASVLGAGPLLRLMNTPEDIYGNAFSYLIVIFFGIFATVFFNLFSSILRALGDSKTPLLFLIIACVINIVLDFVLILVFHMGVAGAATATVIAQAFSAVACFFYSLRRFPVMRLRKEDWKQPMQFIGAHLRIGLPMAFQFSVTAVGSVVLQSALNLLGSVAVAAYTAASRLEQFVIQPMISFGVAMSTYTAQNYGAGKLDRIHEGVRKCLLISVVFSLCATAVMILFGKYLTLIFVGAGETEVIALSQQYLTLTSIFYVTLSLIFVFRNTLQGMGYGMIPVLAGAAELVMRSAGAFILAGLFGFAGVVLSNPAAWIGADIPLVIAYFITMRKLNKTGIHKKEYR